VRALPLPFIADEVWTKARLREELAQQAEKGARPKEGQHPRRESRRRRSPSAHSSRSPSAREVISRIGLDIREETARGQEKLRVDFFKKDAKERAAREKPEDVVNWNEFRKKAQPVGRARPAERAPLAQPAERGRPAKTAHPTRRARSATRHDQRSAARTAWRAAMMRPVKPRRSATTPATAGRVRMPPPIRKRDLNQKVHGPDKRRPTRETYAVRPKQYTSPPSRPSLSDWEEEQDRVEARKAEARRRRRRASPSPPSRDSSSRRRRPDSRRRRSPSATSAGGGTSYQSHGSGRRAPEYAGTVHRNPRPVWSWQEDLLRDCSGPQYDQLKAMAGQITEMAGNSSWQWDVQRGAWRYQNMVRKANIWQLYLILGFLILAATTVKTTRGAEVKHAEGVATFHFQGEVMLQAETQTIIIELPVQRMRERTTELATSIQAQIGKVTKGDEVLEAILTELDDYQGRMVTSVSVFATEIEATSKRSIEEWIGGLLGLYNTFEMSDIKHRIESTKGAIRKTLLQFDAIEEHEKTSDSSLNKVIDEVNRQHTYMLSHRTADHLEAKWRNLRNLYRATLETMRAAASHTLDPAVFSMVNMTKIWRAMKDDLEKADFVPAIQSYRQLVQLHASFAASRESLYIAVQIPIFKKDTVLYRKYAARVGPLLVEDTVVTVVPATQEFIVHPETETLVTTEPREGCTVIGRTEYCNSAHSLQMGATRTCEMALWREEWPKVSHMCGARTEEATPLAWVVNATTFWVILPEETNVVVDCPRLPPVMQRRRGQMIVNLESGCRATAGDIRLKPADFRTPNTTVIRVSLPELRNNSEADEEPEWDVESNLEPADFSFRAEIEKELDKGADHTMIAVIVVVCTVAAAVVVLTVLAMGWLKHRLLPTMAAAKAATGALHESLELGKVEKKEAVKTAKQDTESGKPY
jgi:hypothetical protein